HFLSVFGEQLGADGIPHGAGGHEQRGGFAGDFGRPLFQAVDRGIFAINVIADFGFEHGAPHGGGGLGNGIDAEVDHRFKNSWKTSLESRPPRLVRRRVAPSVSSSPASRKRWMGASKWLHSAA